MMRFTSLKDVEGISTGMNSRDPSFSGGMNSLPNPVMARTPAGGNPARASDSRQDRGTPNASINAAASSSVAADRIGRGCRNDHRRAGSYNFSRKRMIQLSCSR